MNSAAQLTDRVVLTFPLDCGTAELYVKHPGKSELAQIQGLMKLKPAVDAVFKIMALMTGRTLEDLQSLDLSDVQKLEAVCIRLYDQALDSQRPQAPRRMH